MRSIRSVRTARWLVLQMALLFSAIPLAAESGAEAWLRYTALSPRESRSYQSLPGNTVLLGDSSVLKTAQRELVQGVNQMLGKTLTPGSLPKDAVVLGTLIQLHDLIPTLRIPRELRADSYWLKTVKIHGSKCLVIAAPNDRGVLYGVFALLSRLARGESVSVLDEVRQPYAPIRWVNQ